MPVVLQWTRGYSLYSNKTASRIAVYHACRILRSTTWLKKILASPPQPSTATPSDGYVTRTDAALSAVAGKSLTENSVGIKLFLTLYGPRYHIAETESVSESPRNKTAFPQARLTTGRRARAGGSSAAPGLDSSITSRLKVRAAWLSQSPWSSPRGSWRRGFWDRSPPRSRLGRATLK